MATISLAQEKNPKKYENRFFLGGIFGDKYLTNREIDVLKLVFPAACRGTLRESLKTGGFQI